MGRKKEKELFLTTECRKSTGDDNKSRSGKRVRLKREVYFRLC